MNTRNEEIFVKVMRNGFIPQLGICGPIPNPIRITRGQAHSLIVAGIDVYQYFPETKYTEKLTLHNVFGFAKKTEKENPVQQNVKKMSEPIKPVNLAGVKKDIVPTPVVETEAVESVSEEAKVAEADEEELVESVDDADEETPSTNNNQYNNNYSKKNKKKHK